MRGGKRMIPACIESGNVSPRIFGLNFCPAARPIGRCLLLLITTGLITLTSKADPTPPAISPPPGAESTSPAVASPTATPSDGFRDLSSAEFRQLDAARQPIDPAAFRDDLLAAAIFQETNQTRADLGLPVLQPDDKARAAATLHSRWMAEKHLLSHNSTPDQPKATLPADRLAQQGLRPQVAAENIATNFLLDYQSGKPVHVRQENGRKVYSYAANGPAIPPYTYVGFAKVIVAQWMSDPPHRQNIVDPTVRFLGVGVALSHQPGQMDMIYATQDFYAPFAPSPTPEASPTAAP